MRYPPVGFCIYCGATQHSEHRQKLGAEHIVPEGLGGNLILEEASCQRCEGRISSVEGYCLRHIFGPVRYHAKLPSKRPRERPTDVPVELEIGGEWVTKILPVEEVPLMLALVQFKVPGVIRGAPPEAEPIYSDTIHARAVSREQWDALIAKYGATDARSAPLPTGDERFARMLAKIAHSYSWAHQSEVAGYDPLLPQIILGERSPWPLGYLVGDAGGEHPFEKVPDVSVSGQIHHLIEFQEYGLGGGRRVMCVLIWLLAGLLGGPVYRVIVGSNYPLPVDPTFLKQS